jgi:acetyl-CoA carboxylase carboxyltransferase component
MCGKAYDPRLIVAWPSAQIAVMGGKQASETLLAIKAQAMAKEGTPMTETDQQKLLEEIQQRYNNELDPLFAAARLWVDDLIDPARTREVLARGLAMAANNPEIPRFSTGVIQV